MHGNHADEEVPELLEAALDDVGLNFYPPASCAGAEAAVTTLARRVLTGDMEPSALTVWAHRTFGHGTLLTDQRHQTVRMGAEASVLPSMIHLAPPGRAGGGSSSIRKTGGSALGAMYVTYDVAPFVLVTCIASWPLSVNTEPFGRPGPYVRARHFESTNVNDPDSMAMITTPG